MEAIEYFVPTRQILLLLGTMQWTKTNIKLSNFDDNKWLFVSIGFFNLAGILNSAHPI